MTWDEQNPEEISVQFINQQTLNVIERLLRDYQYQQGIKWYLEGKKMQYQKQLEELRLQILDLTEKNERTNQQSEATQQKIKSLHMEIIQLEQKIDCKMKSLKKLEEEQRTIMNELLFENSEIEKEINLFDTNNKYVINNINASDIKLNNLNKQYKELQALYTSTVDETQQFNDLIDQCYMTKKKMNSELQEYRGNIRVYCRIRPFLSNQNEPPIYQLLNQNTLKLNVPKENHKSENSLKDHIYNFEQIFNMQQSQQDIFDQLGQLIQNAVDGKNVCIFAYGQTGSGKTYTMQGGSSEKSEGIIPRSIKLIFSQVKRAQKYKWNFQIGVSIQEVYLQGARDLIDPKNIDDDIISKFTVRYPEELQCYIQSASKNRKVAQTNCNEHSSRSHLIVTIHINSRNEDKNLERKGSLNLVDLAGSQRVNNSKVQGDRLKQTQAINKSLTNLGIVISALAKKQQHIPFRNSKLTFLLQKYLEGDSKTLMFVNISPKNSDFNQTICSLRFAEKVKQCKIKK